MIGIFNEIQGEISGALDFSGTIATKKAVGLLSPIVEKGATSVDSNAIDFEDREF